MKTIRQTGARRCVKRIKGKPVNLKAFALNNSDSGFGKPGVHAYDRGHKPASTHIPESRLTCKTRHGDFKSGSVQFLLGNFGLIGIGIFGNQFF